MTRRFVCVGVLAAAAVLSAPSARTVLAAQAGDAWAHWQFTAPVNVPSASAARWVAVVIGADVTRAARPGWADLRVIDEQNREVPFALRARVGGTGMEWRLARVLDPTVVPGQYSQATLDAGAGPAIHNAVRIETKGTDDFLTWVEVAVSDDAREWRLLRERAPVYRLTSERRGERSVVHYPDSTSRYLRVRFLDGSRRYDVIGADVAREGDTTSELVPSDIVFHGGTGAPKRSVWVAGPGDVAPMAALRFEVSQPRFDRAVAVETSADGQRWHPTSSGEIYRATVAGVQRTSLVVPVPGVASPFWRVTVFNGDDAPLEGVSIALIAVPRRVVFEGTPGHTYWLIFGNARADAPTYDVDRVNDASVLDAAAPATIGAVVTNAGYADPAPWTERHPALLWSALAAAVMVVGALAIRTIRGV